MNFTKNQKYILMLALIAAVIYYKQVEVMSFLGYEKKKLADNDTAPTTQTASTAPGKTPELQVYSAPDRTQLNSDNILKGAKYTT